MSEREMWMGMISAMDADGAKAAVHLPLNYQLVQDLADYPEEEITPNFAEWLESLVEALAHAQRALDSVSELLQESDEGMDYWYRIFQSERKDA